MLADHAADARWLPRIERCEIASALFSEVSSARTDLLSVVKVREAVFLSSPAAVDLCLQHTHPIHWTTCPSCLPILIPVHAAAAAQAALVLPLAPE